LRIWPAGDGSPIVVTLSSPLNAVAVAPDGDIITAGADGQVYVVGGNGELRGAIAAQSTPIIALSVSDDGALVGAAGFPGSVAILDRRRRALLRTLVGPGLPVWSAAFLPGGQTLLTGGTDRVIRRWNAANGDPIGSVVTGGVDDPLAAY